MPPSSSVARSADQDRECANLARAALFPKRMHRDVADASHFPALLQLDLLRNQILSTTPSASISSVFPRHVVVVRNLADGGTQWNGEPDLETGNKFHILPDRLSVTCSSSICNEFLTGSNKSQRAFRRVAPSGEEEIVLCSDRILKSDSNDKRYQGVAKELPPQSYQAVEEVLAHQLVQVRHQDDTNKAQVELQAAKAAECYFSRHSYDGKAQVKKGSRLQTGYSLLPGYIQSWSMKKCLSAVAMEHLVAQKQFQTRDEAQKAVQEAWKHRQ
jgi:Peptidase M76 family